MGKNARSIVFLWLEFFFPVFTYTQQRSAPCCNHLSINHSAELTFLLISSVRVCCPCVIAHLMCVSSQQGWVWVVPAAAVAVYLYNSALFKLWYLSGQVEVYCFMSSMWLQLGRCVVDRRLCPVSDWGLGLVTGPVLIGSPSFSLLPRHPPSLSPPQGEARGCHVGIRGAVVAGMEGQIRCLGWLDGLLPLSEEAHTNISTATRTGGGAHLTQCPLSCLLHWQPQPCPLCPAVMADSPSGAPRVHKLHRVKMWACY